MLAEKEASRKGLSAEIENIKNELVVKEIKLSLISKEPSSRSAARPRSSTKKQRVKILDAKKKGDEFCDQKLRNLEAEAGEEGGRIRRDRAMGKEEVEGQAKESA